MNYTFDQLKEDVRKEAEALRVHATEEELNRITVEAFSPKSRYNCIYGLAAEDCHCDRAVELIEKCCVRYFVNNEFTLIEKQGFKGIVSRVNGERVDNFLYDRQSTIPGHYSAIEAYILLPEAKNANLIAYLRGETETLEL